MVNLPTGPQLTPSAEFFAVTAQELNTLRRGICPRFASFECGHCGRATNGRVVAGMTRGSDSNVICWSVCACPEQEPTLLVVDAAGATVWQLPEHTHFQSDAKWPETLRLLFDESAMAFAAGAYTASSMVSRKILMACACHEGDAEGKHFVQYVDFIIDKVLTFPRAKDAIKAIKDIGNDANHVVCFVSREDAQRSLSIVDYMLKTIYSLPLA